MADELKKRDEELLGVQSEAVDRRKAVYKAVFNANETGREALANLLIDLKYFETCETAEDVALRNAATRLMYDMGIYPSGSGEEALKEVLTLVRAMLPIGGKQ